MIQQTLKRPVGPLVSIGFVESAHSSTSNKVGEEGAFYVWIFWILQSQKRTINEVNWFAFSLGMADDFDLLANFGAH